MASSMQLCVVAACWLSSVLVLWRTFFVKKNRREINTGPPWKAFPAAISHSHLHSDPPERISPTLALHAQISPLPPSSLMVQGAPTKSTHSSPFGLAKSQRPIALAAGSRVRLRSRPTASTTNRAPALHTQLNPAHTRAVPRRPCPSSFCGDP